MLRRLLYWLLPQRRKEGFLSPDRCGGCKRSPKDDRDYTHTLPGGLLFYQDLFVLDDTTPIENQASYESCVSHMVSSEVEQMAKVNGWPHHFELSRMHNFNEGRKLSGTYPENQGMYIRDGLKAAQQEGITIEKLFPYNKESFNGTLSMGARIFRHWYPAFTYHFIRYASKEEKIKAIQHAHQDLHVPVGFGVKAPQSFFNPKKGETYKPKKGERNILNHAMRIIGLDVPGNRALIRNSWGSSWGDKGELWVDLPWLFSNAYDLHYVRKA